MKERQETSIRYRVHFFRTAAGGEPVREWLQALSKDERRLLGEAIQALQMEGPALSLPFARPLGKRLHELRERVGKVRYRIFYVFDGGALIVLLHAATKDQRVAEDDVALARKRQKDYFGRR